jgi:hypothetical protein
MAGHADSKFLTARRKNGLLQGRLFCIVHCTKF